MDFGVEGDGGAGGDFDGLAGGDVTKQDGGIGPFEVPPIFDGEEGVVPGEKRAHGERAIGVALVAVVDGHVVAGIPGNEKNHGAGNGLSVL